MTRGSYCGGGENERSTERSYRDKRREGEESDAEAYLGALICPLGDVFIEYTRPNVLDYSRRVLHW
jgi:hypothetical protein